jgi:hypothetical protein
MKIIVCLLVLGVGLPLSLQAQQLNRCPRGTEDMLNYFVMGYPNRVDHFMGPGNANPIYTAIDPELGSSGFGTQGTFAWVKSIVGYPWDVDTYDTKYIYHRSTELKWTDATTFKRQANDLPISQRCISTRTGGLPLRATPSQTTYSFYANCQPYQTANLSYTTNTISAPMYVNTGGNLGTVKTRLLVYQYSCNSKYQACQFMEVFSLGNQIGLYDWKYYKSQNGKWVQSQESAINNLDPGQTTPSFACTNTYE